MGANFTDIVKRRIVELHNNLNYGVKKTQRKIMEDGHTASRTGIYSVIKKRKTEKTISQKPKPFREREPYGITNELLDLIHDQYE